MTCMTTKQKFEVADPEVVVLRNNRYAYRATCPWSGRSGKPLVAYKFCSAEAHRDYEARQKASTSDEKDEHLVAAESEHFSSEDETELI